MELSRIAFSHDSPARGWPYRCRSRGTTMSSILDHDFGHLCRGRRIQMSGHFDLGIFNKVEASSILSGRHLWCRRTLLCTRARIVFHYAPHRAQSGLCIFEMIVPTPHSWGGTCPSAKKNGLFFSFFVLPEWPPSCCSLLLIAMVAFFRASPILYPPRLWHPVFFIARGMGTNLCTKL